jgi:hypothetical protein
VDFSEVPRVFRGDDYDRVRSNWTRQGRLLRDFGTAFEVWAVFKGHEFRQAYVERYADLYGISEASRVELRQSQIEAAGRGYEFHVTAQSSNYKWNDLEDRESTWRVSLLDGTGAELSPDEVRLLQLPEPYEVTFFPNRTAFTRTYAIRFARPERDAQGRRWIGAESGRLTMRIAGPLGRVELAWQAR